MMAMTGMNSAPVIDNDIRTKFANDADHVLNDLAIPDLFRFFRRFGESKIAGAREIKFHAITAGGSEKFLRAD